MLNHSKRKFRLAVVLIATLIIILGYIVYFDVLTFSKAAPLFAVLIFYFIVAFTGLLKHRNIK